MQNTRICYLYRDASNNKAYREEVVKGLISIEQVDKYITERDDENILFFLPGQVGLPWGQQEFIEKSNNPELDYNYNFPNDNDHVWCVLDSMVPTDDPPTLEITADQLMRNFSTVDWDEVAA